MTTTARLTFRSADAAANAIAGLSSGGTLRIFTAPRPEPETPVSGQKMLVEFMLSVPAFGPSQFGVIELNGDLTSIADRAGEANWFRVFAPDGIGVFDGSVAESSDADMNLSTVDIPAGAEISVTAFRYVQRR